MVNDLQHLNVRDHRGRDRLQSVPITTKVVRNPTYGYSIQHYVMKFVSDLWQVGGFLRVLLFPPLIKQTDTI